MANAFFNTPKAVNEPVKSYAPGSPETISLKKTLADMKSVEMDIPMIIGGKEVFTNDKYQKVFVNSVHLGERKRIDKLLQKD